MKLADKILEIVEKSLTDLQAYTELYNKEEKETRSKLIADSKLKYKENPESIDIEALAKDLFYLKGFHQVDIRRLQTAFLNNYELYKKLELEKEVSEDAESVANVLKGNLGSQSFVVDKGTFQERVAGSTEIAMQKFKENNYFKIFEAQLIKLLND